MYVALFNASLNSAIENFHLIVFDWSKNAFESSLVLNWLDCMQKLFETNQILRSILQSFQIGNLDHHSWFN